MKKNFFIYTLLFTALSSVTYANGKLPQLDFSKYPQQIFWLIITFALTYFFVSKVVFPKIVNIKQARHTKILTNVEQTIKLKKDIDSINKSIVENKSQITVQIANLNQDLNNKIAKLKAKHSKEIEEYKKTARLTFLTNKTNYKSNNKYTSSTFEEVCTEVLKKLDITVDKSTLSNNINKIINQTSKKNELTSQ